MSPENGRKQLSLGSYQQLDSMIASLEAGDLQDFAPVKHLITSLGREGFDLNEYPRRLSKFENNLIRRSEQGDPVAASTLLLMASQLEQRLNGVYSGDIETYRKASYAAQTI